MSTRTDLLALTEDSLAALTNRGLVKRAAKEVERAAPTVVCGEDGTLRGTFADGVTTELPTGGLGDGRCGCGAPGTCRHVVGLVLAYQRTCGRPAPFEEWSPAEFTDEQLLDVLGPRVMAAARRTERAGYRARVRQATVADPVPQVELGSASVRFLVPHDLGFVDTDVAGGARGEVLALGVWAFRAADETAPGQPEAEVHVGGAAATTASGTGLEPTLLLVEAVLRHGAVHAGAGVDGVLADERRRLDAQNLRWPLLALADLADQLAAYRERGARYRPDRVAYLLAEVYARHRAVRGDAVRRSAALGTEEAAEAPLRRARLDGLGARVRAVGEERVVELFFAHADTATVLTLQRQWASEEDGSALARRRLGGATVGALAGGTVVTESAVRSASRRIRLATARVAQTTVTPSRGHWDALPTGLLVRDLRQLAAELEALPPRVVRPRYDAELVRAVAVAEVRTLGYSPGAQRLDALIADETGAAATITVTHERAAPGRVDAVAIALRGDRGPVRYVSGAVHRRKGGLIIEPLAIAVDGELVVPDLSPSTAGRLAGPLADEPDLIVDVLNEARDCLAEVAHRGLAHLPLSFAGRLRATAEHLRRLGLGLVAQDLERFADRLGPDPGDDTVVSWVDATLRVSIALELW